MDNDLEIMQKEAVVTKSVALSQHLTGATEANDG
jgi:hypothetical protein